jgi:catechol 2,3-dioxygenase-like lactoylglutathione lyase family enzyme
MGRLKMSREKSGLWQCRRCREVKVNVERISAMTLEVANMAASVRFYRDVLGLETIYGGEEAYFSSLRTTDGKNPILNLEQGKPATEWGRLIFYVVDVDASWAYLKGRGFEPERPRDASWGERYFHMSDPRGPRAGVCASDLAVSQ